MYFLAKGDCVVLIKDRVFDGHEEIKHRSLLPGDHFGVSSYFDFNRHKHLFAIFNCYKSYV